MCVCVICITNFLFAAAERKLLESRQSSAEAFEDTEEEEDQEEFWALGHDQGEDFIGFTISPTFSPTATVISLSPVMTSEDGQEEEELRGHDQEGDFIRFTISPIFSPTVAVMCLSPVITSETEEEEEEEEEEEPWARGHDQDGKALTAAPVTSDGAVAQRRLRRSHSDSDLKGKLCMTPQKPITRVLSDGTGRPVAQPCLRRSNSDSDLNGASSTVISPEVLRFFSGMQL